jgi:glutathione peroxidase-family protein
LKTTLEEYEYSVRKKYNCNAAALTTKRLYELADQLRLIVVEASKCGYTLAELIQLDDERLAEGG